jgi:hypothetical protein
MGKASKENEMARADKKKEKDKSAERNEKIP